MAHMELRSTFTTSIFLVLILALPFFSRAAGESEALNSEVYEIDYRGPETHSSVPPPHHSGGKPHSHSHLRAGKAFGLMGSAQNKASLSFHAPSKIISSKRASSCQCFM
ncbi:hypothetical protein SESBI_39753 [Sesbania bispinosa]|nr:hypothetical protein SESBI_39753 [Sesbania bispinosa]